MLFLPTELCSHDHLYFVSMDTLPPIVTGICPDCEWRFPQDGSEPFNPTTRRPDAEAPRS